MQPRIPVPRIPLVPQTPRTPAQMRLRAERPTAVPKSNGRPLRGGESE